MQKPPKLFGGVHRARPWTGKKLFVHGQHPALAHGAQVPVMQTLIQGLGIGIHRAALDDVHIRVSGQQGFFIKAHQLFFVRDHILPASTGYDVIPNAAPPRRQQIGVPHLIKNTNWLLILVAGLKGRKPRLPRACQPGGFSLASGELAELLQYAKHLLEGIHFKNKHVQAKGTQGFGLQQRFVAPGKLDDQIGRLLHDKLCIGAHVGAYGGQMLQSGDVCVSHGAGRKTVASAQRQQKFVEGSVEGYDALCRSVQTHLMPCIVTHADRHKGGCGGGRSGSNARSGLLRRFSGQRLGW